MQRPIHFAAAKRRAIHIIQLVLGVCIAVVIACASVAAQVIDRKDRVIFELTKPIEEPTNFNWFVRQPDKKADRREYGAHQVMWEPLFLVNYETGDLEKILGESFTSDAAHKVWTIILRKGVEWSDSKKPPSILPPQPPVRPFTADDVIFTVKMALANPALTALEAARLRGQLAKDPEKVDAHTVRFTLTNSNPRFVLENFGGSLFSSFLIMPAHIWGDALDKKKFSDPSQFPFGKPVGTGPYLLKDAKDINKERAIWTLNKDWWGSKVVDITKMPAQIEWRYVASEAASMAKLENDEIDAAREYSRKSFDDVRKTNASVIGWERAKPPGSPPPETNPAWTDPCPRQLEINIKYSWDDGKVLTPWSDPKLRRALAMLIDRKSLAGNTYEGVARPSVTMFPAYKAMEKFVTAATKPAAGYELSETAKPAEAAALFSEVGYAKDASGFYQKGPDTLTATILVNADLPRDVDAANKLEAQMTAAGIKTKVESIPNGDYWGRAVPKGEYEMIYGWLSCGSIVEPYTSMRRYLVTKAADPKDNRPPPIGVRSPGFDNTGRWDTPAAEKYSEIVRKLGELPVGQGETLVTEAYAHLNAEMPFIPLLHVPRIIPFTTKYWTGWPESTVGGMPMHSWSQMRRLLPGLKKAP
jgi:peptide/nickel transport system substrate-binding protein